MRHLPLRNALAACLLGMALTVPVATAAPAVKTPHFVEETATAGIAHTYDGGPEYVVGGGVSAFDCNADGKPDLFFAGGANPAALYRNDSAVGGALAFTQLRDPVTDLTDVTGAYPIDIDGDGITDLVVLRFGENVILRGLGDCRFERANEAWAFDGGAAPTTAFSATWEGAATLPTLAFGNYVVHDPNGGADTCSDDALVRPDPAGAGYAAPIALTPGYCALSVLFSDWDRSGRSDLRISNDRHYYGDVGQEQLWRIEAGQAPVQYTKADGWMPLQIWGMGISSYDVTGDGYPEVFLSSQADNKLQTLAKGPAQPTYKDIALKRGVTLAHPNVGGDVEPSTAWHSEFQDVNNDGLVDLFIAKGNVDNIPGYAQKDPSNLMLGQPNGTFKDAAEASGILSYAPGRGAALADLNLDGMLDLVEVNHGQPVRIWRDVGSGDATTPAPMGGWLALQLEQPGPNRDAIGAWVEVKAGDHTMQREITIGGGHGGGQLGWIHFGLGSADTAEVRVQWPDGVQGPWIPVAANQFATITRDATQATPWQPPRG